MRIQQGIPVCDICHNVPAVYDGKTIAGPWAYMCEGCFKGYGLGLGVGRGQRLITDLPDEPPPVKEGLK